MEIPTQHKRLGYMPVYFPPVRKSTIQAIANWLERRVKRGRIKAIKKWVTKCEKEVI